MCETRNKHNSLKANICLITFINNRTFIDKPENYRPVSLTSVVCKLLKTLVRDHMVEFLVKHNLINTSPHGFLTARSCLTNLLCFFEEITKWVDDGSPVDVVYLDFQKAFD